MKGLWGMRLMLRVWQLFGRRAFTVLLWPVIGVYWLTADRRDRLHSSGQHE